MGVSFVAVRILSLCARLYIAGAALPELSQDTTVPRVKKKWRMRAEPVRHITAVASDVVSGLYRFTIPLRALIELGTSTGNVSIGLAHIPQITPGSPLLLQGALTLPAAVVAAAKENNCRLVLDFDELPWSLSGDDRSASATSPALTTSLDRQIACADAITVSTEPLAQAMRERGYDPIVLPSLVDRRDWTVQPRRTERQRARIGWYSRRPMHAEDLTLTEQVVRALIDEVDFVFLGNVPAALSDIAERVEHYPPVPLALFPTLLASVDLDIMLAPLAHNAFNECNSNLPLLQAGMLGYPVIATDIDPYRTLPVTRLPNTPHAWVSAIRNRWEHPAALRREGETLRRAVHANFLVQAWTHRYLELWTGAGAGAPAAHA